MAAEQYTEQLLLHRLVFENDVDALGVAIASQTYDLNEQDGRGRTPLRLAVRMNHERCVQVLLDAGADLGGVDAQGTEIETAVWEHHHNPLTHLKLGSSITDCSPSFH
eukprot:m.95602 g.95602  ORF g.95602 m.95602 type:complete len:108 (+) comp13060_c0_seq8:71-394(+)